MTSFSLILKVSKTHPPPPPLEEKMIDDTIEHKTIFVRKFGLCVSKLLGVKH